MALRDPVAVYNAANNTEAQMVRNALVSSGVEAYVTEDISQVGTYIFGLIPEIHKPQVWVDRDDVARATLLLEQYEQRSAQLRGTAADGETAVTPVEVVCESCGHRATFPGEQRGSVQECPECGAYVDVGEEEGQDWGTPEGEDEGPQEPETKG